MVNEQDERWRPEDPAESLEPIHPPSCDALMNVCQIPMTRHGMSGIGVSDRLKGGTLWDLRCLLVFQLIFVHTLLCTS